MAERTIGIGDTSSFRYIGIEPPLDDAATKKLAKQIILPDWVEHTYIFRKQQTDTDGPHYTELGFDVGSPLDWLGTETVNEGTVRVAEQIATLLRTQGDTVTVLDGIYPTDFQTPIFGRSWVAMKEVAELLSQPRDE